MDRIGPENHQHAGSWLLHHMAYILTVNRNDSNVKSLSRMSICNEAGKTYILKYG